MAHANPIYDEQGNMIGAANVLMDVTERSELDRVRAHLAAIINSSDDAIVSKTLDGMITLWNAAAERIFGYTAEEAVGRPITMIIHRADGGARDSRAIANRRTDRPLRDSPRGERHAPAEQRFRKSRGRLICLTFATRPAISHG